MILGALWVYGALGDILTSIVSKLSLLEALSSQRYDNLWVAFSPQCHQQCFFLLMKFSELDSQAIPSADFWSFINAMWVRDQNLGTPPTEDAVFKEK